MICLFHFFFLFLRFFYSFISFLSFFFSSSIPCFHLSVVILLQFPPISFLPSFIPFLSFSLIYSVSFPSNSFPSSFMSSMRSLLARFLLSFSFIFPSLLHLFFVSPLLPFPSPPGSTWAGSGHAALTEYSQVVRGGFEPPMWRTRRLRDGEAANVHSVESSLPPSKCLYV